MEHCDADGVHDLSRQIHLPNIKHIAHLPFVTRSHLWNVVISICSQASLIPLACSFGKQPVELVQRIEVEKAQAMLSSLSKSSQI